MIKPMDANNHILKERMLFDAYIESEVSLLDHCLNSKGLSDQRIQYPDLDSIRKMRYLEDGRAIVEEILNLAKKKYKSNEPSWKARYTKLSNKRSQSFNRCVTENTSLVRYMIHKWNKNGISQELLEDYTQEGNIGLMIAVARFNPDLGHRFSTYATWWIKQGMRRYSEANRSLIRIPYNLMVELHQVDRDNRISYMVHGERSIDLYSDHTVKTRPRLRFARHSVVSLDAPVKTDSEMSWYDTVPSSEEGPDRATFHREISEIIRELYKVLDHKELDILKRRFGLDGQKEHTLQEIATRLNISRERVRQIEVICLRKIKNYAAKRGKNKAREVYGNEFAAQ
jgi:RNA polymerase sigma factor (sigma-70 family)